MAWVTSTTMAIVGSQQVGRGLRAVDPDLLLNRCDPGDADRVAAALMTAARVLERDVGAEAVVHRARGETIAGEPQGLGVDHDRVADAHHAQRLVAVSGADVDVKPLDLDDLLALLVLEQVDWLAADDAGHRAVLGVDRDSLADENLRVPAADGGEPGEALLVNVGDRQADLVDVADDGDERVGVAPGYAGDRRAELVGLDLGKRRGLAPDRGGLRLVARRSGRAQQLLQGFGDLWHLSSP